MPAIKRDHLVGTPRASSLRQLAATLPSFDQALDDFIARAHQTELSVADDDVIATEPAPDAITDPSGDPLATHATFADPPAPEPVDPQREHAEAYALALRGQLAGLQRRLAEAEAHEPALRGQLAALQHRLAELESRTSTRRPVVLAATFAFAAGLAVMFAASRLVIDRAPTPAAPTAALPPRGPAPIVTPIDPSPLSPAPAPPSPPPSRPSPSPPHTSTSPSVAASAHTDPPHAITAPPAAPRAPASDLVDPFASPPQSGSGSATSTLVNPF